MSAVAAEVIAILGVMGAKGIKRVRCKVLEGKYKNKIVIRNVMGPIRQGDIVMIKEVAMEAAGVIE